MSWHRVCGDVPEGRPILILCDLAVRAGVRAIYYPYMTFMDARTFEILQRSPWMPGGRPAD